MDVEGVLLEEGEVGTHFDQEVLWIKVSAGVKLIELASDTFEIH